MSDNLPELRARFDIQRQGKDSVILLTVDSLRLDRLSCYNPSVRATPAVDQLAAKGWIFTNAISHGGATPEAFPSILKSS
ncbi:MAG: sulfatase-like hydrolase/transferase, partial [Nitrososphaerota archaeon]|nr:sulfatase-like hydrolase/transferase [Nitrososphaerota archaeon]